MSSTPEELLYDRLLTVANEGSVACGCFLASLQAVDRSAIYTSLLFERLRRKMYIVKDLREEANRNWNQTFYLLYFRTLGDQQNQAAYLDLARRVPYRIVLRERLTPHAIEAMFFGASGLLDLYPSDSYTERLRSEFAHLKEKHNIEPMDAKQWILREVRPANHPVLRLAQAAEFFLQDDFLMNRILLCTTEEDVCKLFCIEAGEYWLTHDIPGSEGRPRPKRLGAFKANIIGINLVVILQFAYGFFGGYMRYQEQALELLQRLPAEDNRYTRLWQAEGVKPQDAFESQALLQLITEHCLHQDCRQCPLAKRMVERL
ncbi:MAG: DUF2851 family protein [Alistipes sp.]|nr:DUF2851 family protein [Alistipes sp.]